MDLSLPFATAFGLADTREHCIESSQGVYRRLLLEDSLKSTGVLDFSTISVLAKADSDGLDVDEIDPAKMKDLIRLFRPSRDGKLTMLEFVKSVDTVYKSLRLLRASISNSSQIGHATEIMINVVFYFFVFCIILASFKVNPLAFFLSLSSVIIAFAFMIGAASAKYFEVSDTTLQSLINHFNFLIHSTPSRVFYSFWFGSRMTSAIELPFQTLTSIPVLTDPRVGLSRK